MLEPRRTFPPLAYLGFGMAAAIIGLLPWIITGMRLPLQNLWAANTLPADMPIALLPFSQYYLSLIVALIVIGSTIAGIVGRATSATNRRVALFALMGGVLLVQVIALVQAAITAGSGLDDRAASGLYVAALVGGTIAAILLGLGMLALIARAPRPGALVALSIAAVAFSSWLSVLVFPVGALISELPYTDAMSQVIHVAPAVLVGVAIVWCGVGTVGQVIAAIGSLLVLWVGPTLVTAVSAAAGSRVLLPYPAEMLDYGLGVFRQAIAMPDLWAMNLAIAIVVAIVGLVGKRLLGRRPDRPADEVSANTDSSASEI